MYLSFIIYIPILFSLIKLGLPCCFGSMDATFIPWDRMPKENHNVGSCHAADDNGMPPPLIVVDANDGDNVPPPLINLIAAVAAAY